MAAEEEAAEYPRLLAAARHVPTAARPWVTAEVPQPAAVREAALRPQEAVAVVVAAVAAAPQSGDPSVVAWQARRSAGPAVSGGQAAARDAVGAAAAAPHGAAAAAEEVPREGEAAAVEAPREEAVAAVGAPHEAVAAEAEVPHAEEVVAVARAAGAVAALRRVAPAAAAELPLAAAWAFRRDQVLPWPGP